MGRRKQGLGGSHLKSPQVWSWVRQGKVSEQGPAEEAGAPGLEAELCKNSVGDWMVREEKVSGHVGVCCNRCAPGKVKSVPKAGAERAGHLRDWLQTRKGVGAGGGGTVDA